MKFLAIGCLLAIGANGLYIKSGAIRAPDHLRLRSANSSICGTQLTDNFEFPHLIVPVNSSAPDTALGTSFNGQVSSTISSLFNFDIPAGGELKTCSLVFHFPSTMQHPSNYYTFEGDGNIRFGKLETPAQVTSTFNNAPPVREDYGSFAMQPGNAYSIANFQCPMGEKIAFQMSNAGSTVLSYFQNYGDPPFGLFITRCTGQ
ncbi:hypothetical protein D8B26_004557 [Coccidioides posadasii str. Silveira]|uniref:Uncharacterized protein n=2 Tax=Coccidioides posadasii TaxID=199306 RepID=E9DEN1_COCPS|nr:conserved hypothetical protein [Coccidioides posadasii str. Silveira]KMM68866.1 hypothetical protein CPAG_05190 [Coccidioides posadasii RMSCC 3488]QVM09897.1 hypothetical protein D8B26_004557 [Coccidioides posadasii str. Silveira]